MVNTCFANPAAGACPPPLTANLQLLFESVEIDIETSSTEDGTKTQSGDSAPSCSDQ